MRWLFGVAEQILGFEIGSNMMRLTRIIMISLLAMGLAGGMQAAQAQEAGAETIVLAQARKGSSAPRHLGTHVYLLRGFMDIFSTGMDDLGAKLNRRGIRATVHGHGEYQSLAAEIAERHRRGIRENVVIIGHSLGANAAFQMAEELGKHQINVPLIIAYDPTSPMSAGSNVSRVVNFYSSTNGWGVPISRGPGFRGSLSNVDLSRRGEMGHTDIDKSPALHAQSINYIQSIGGGGTRSATTAPSQQKSSADEKGSAVKTDAKAAANQTEKTASPESSASAKETASAKEKDKDAAAESTASIPSEAKPNTAAAPDSKPKPAADKTETAASSAASSTSN